MMKTPPVVVKYIEGGPIKSEMAKEPISLVKNTNYGVRKLKHRIALSKDYEKQKVKR
jgi:hypothetical protein